MPSNFMTADTSFPKVEGMSQKEQVTTILNYLYMVMEQLRYTLGNLGQDNFNDAELEGLGKIITEPLTIRVKDAEEGVATLTVNAKGISSKVESLDGRFSQVEQDVNGLNIRSSGGGTTYITGDHVQSGVITGSVLECTLKQNGSGTYENEGHLDFFYELWGNRKRVGELYLKDTATEGSEHTLSLETVDPDFALKLSSAGDSSYSSKGVTYLHADQGFKVDAGGTLNTENQGLNSGDFTVMPAPGKRVAVHDGSGDWYYFKGDGFYHGATRISKSESEVNALIDSKLRAFAAKNNLTV